MLSYLIAVMHAVDLSAGWALQRWTNGNVDPQSAVSLTGEISPGGFLYRL